MKSLRYQLALLVIFMICSPMTMSAQCAMCRAALLTSENQGVASGINHGITYLMVFPYILVAILGYVVYRIIKKESSPS